MSASSLSSAAFVAAIAAFAAPFAFAQTPLTPDAPALSDTRAETSVVKEDWELETESFLKAERIFDAIERLHRQTERTPSNPKVWLALIRLLDEGGRPEFARVIAVRASDACPTDFKCQLLGGLAHRESADPANAEVCLRRAIAIDPKAVDPRLALVEILIDYQRNDEAIRAVDEALKACGDNYQLFKLAACARCNASDYQGMARFRKKAADRRRQLIDSGVVELARDEFVFHFFPVNNGAGVVRVFDGFASDEDNEATIMTFRLIRRDRTPVAAYLLRRTATTTGSAATAAQPVTPTVEYRLEKYDVQSTEPVILRRFGATEPAYQICMNAVVADSRETLTDADAVVSPSGKR
ncbi:MAG: tetratricopeptide repeat protein [Planctomycetota bacterium]